MNTARKQFRIDRPGFRYINHPCVEWYDIVDYDRAICLLSTDWHGMNAKPFLDNLTIAQCNGHAAGAWDANERGANVAFRSAAAHKGTTL
jgi:hypothetical protein